MTWLTWRQFRLQAIVAGGALAALAIALVATGPHLAAAYDNAGLASCRSGCGSLASNFITAVQGTATEIIFYTGIIVVYAAPAMMGLFWGAPLVTREIESGSFRLAWNQSVTRSRWIATKLGLIGLAAIATAGLFSLMTSWWASPLYRAAEQSGGNTLSINRLGPALFGAAGIAPVGYAAFAFALGVSVGVVVRRTVPAMALTIAIFAAVQILVPAFIRPHLITPAHAVEPLNSVSLAGFGDTSNGTIFLQVGSINGASGAWIISSHPANAAGQAVTHVPQACASISGNFVQCLASHGVHAAVAYQPVSRYWPLQWTETGIYLVLALGLGGISYWRVRRLS